jgi:hypothetical protein
VQSSEPAHFTSEIVGYVFATDSCEKSCLHSAESCGFSPGAPVSFLPQGKLTGWVRINIVRKVILQFCKDSLG